MAKDIPSVPLASSPLRLKVSLSRPLRHARYRQLWTANLLSNIGTWTQAFASAWLIASMSHSASTTTLVQTAAYAPILLFALVAGVVADAVDRPKLLFIVNLMMALCACAMAVLVISGHAAAGPVLLLTFMLGTGSAFMWPAWQAAMSGLVQPDEVEAAATLNTLSYNVAAIVGPAIGGILFNWIGAGALFLVNAISFLGLLTVYWSWWREGAMPCPAKAALWPSFTAGLTAAFGSRRYRRIVLHVGTVFFASIAFAALLPVYVRDVLRLDSGVFGLLMGSLGGGVVLAAFILPSLRVRLDRTRLLAGGLVLYGLMLISISFATQRLLLMVLIVCGGMAWSAIVSTLNAAAQSSFPATIRARTLSIYLLVMAAGYTAGSVFWGALADRFGVAFAVAAAGACLIANAAALACAEAECAI